jgi:uncharacterized protein (DUF1330 family)
MPAYIIAQINVLDPQKYQEYAKLAGPATLKYGKALLPLGGISGGAREAPRRRGLQHDRRRRSVILQFFP